MCLSACVCAPVYVPRVIYVFACVSVCVPVLVGGYCIHASVCVCALYVYVPVCVYAEDKERARQ